MHPSSPLAEPDRPKIPSKKSPAPITLPFELNRAEQEYLWLWMRNGGNDFDALTAAGYTPSTAQSARHMGNQIREKIDHACDIGAVFDLSGHGVTAYVERILHLSYSDNLKFESVGAKLWGLARQYFSGKAEAQGAGIHLHVHQAPSQQGLGQANGIVSISVDARRRELPEHPGDEAELSQ
jgi:hypothetical protein